MPEQGQKRTRAKVLIVLSVDVNMVILDTGLMSPEDFIGSAHPKTTRPAGIAPPPGMRMSNRV